MYFIWIYVLTLSLSHIAEVMGDSVEQTLNKPQMEKNAAYMKPGHLSCTPKPKVLKAPPKKTGSLSQQVFTGRDIVAGVFNPWLKAKPDKTETTDGKLECLRRCQEHANCMLVNFHSKGHCAMYWDPERADKLGADSELGWSVWERHR